jgi:methylglutaconyl-CoA hydratase
MMYKQIEVGTEKNILSIKLNRPEVRNAFHPEMIAEMTTVFKKLKKEKNIRAVVLSGAGASFCAGADLEWMKSMARFSKAQNLKDSQKLYDMFAVMRDCEVPLVGKIHGHAMGGALGLISVCDIAIAQAGTQFCFSEAKLGLSPAVISVFVKNKMLASQMQKYFLTAEIFAADAAAESGLIHTVANDKAALEDETIMCLKHICANGPEAIKATKRLLKTIQGQHSEAKKRAYTTATIASLRVSKEGQEGLLSFFEKRKPKWRSE